MNKVIKPDNRKNSNNLVSAAIYLTLGIILAFKSDEAVKFIFYLIGSFIIVYGIKSLVEYFKDKDFLEYQNINLSIGVVSIIIGILLIILAGAINLGIRYIIGFFLLYIGISRLLLQISYGKKMNYGVISSILLIILGLYSIIISNAILVIIGWILIINSIILVIEYIKN